MQNHASMRPLRPIKMQTQPTRRQLLTTSAMLGTSLLIPQQAAGADLPEDLMAAIKAFTQGALLREGRVTFEVALLDRKSVV